MTFSGPQLRSGDFLRTPQDRGAGARHPRKPGCSGLRLGGPSVVVSTVDRVIPQGSGQQQTVPCAPATVCVLGNAGSQDTATSPVIPCTAGPRGWGLACTTRDSLRAEPRTPCCPSKHEAWASGRRGSGAALCQKGGLRMENVAW